MNKLLEDGEWDLKVEAISTEGNASYMFTAFERKFHFYKIAFRASSDRSPKRMQ